MTWKEKKLVTILTGVLAVLAIVLLLVLSSRYRENQKDTPASSAFIGVTEEGSGDYTSLTYFNGTTTLENGMKRNNLGKQVKKNGLKPCTSFISPRVVD